MLNYFLETDSFTLKDAEDAVLNHYQQDVKVPSIRARIYEGIEKGIFTRLGKGVYAVSKKDAQGKESTCLLVNGDGRDLSFIADESIDALITDHPYKIDTALKGGNRDFANYELFKYEQKDFDEKQRVLKHGLNIQGLDSYGLRDLLEGQGLEVSFMKGTAGMLPTEFDFQPKGKKEKVMEAEKPVELFDAILPYIALPGETVLDTFAGSGNVGISALTALTLFGFAAKVEVPLFEMKVLMTSLLCLLR